MAPLTRIFPAVVLLAVTSTLAKDAVPPLPSVSEVARRASPAVVRIESAHRGDPGVDKRSLGVGTGVILREDGLIVTSYHVIDGAERLSVTLAGQEKALPASLLAGDSRSDIALIRVEKGSRRFSTLTLGDSDKVRVGDAAIAVGNPFGFDHTVTSGIVSARGRNGAAMGPFGDPGPDVDDMIQTDAAINPGNSGGPLLNAEGEMVGLNTAIFSQSGAFIGIGFAIPSRVVREITDQLLKNGRVIRGWLGVTAQNLNDDLAKKFATEKRGALVSDVRPKSPALRAGLKAGDIIRSFDGKPVPDSATLKSLAVAAPAGKPVAIEFLRHGKTSSVRLLVEEQPQPEKEQAQKDAGLAAKLERSRPLRSTTDLGLSLQNVPGELREMMGLDSKEGVLVGQVSPTSAASEAGLSPGDVLLAVEREAVGSADDASTRITRWLKTRRDPDPLLLLVQRGPGDRVFIALSIK